MLTQTQKLLLFSNLLLSNTAAKCPFGFGAKEDDAKPEEHALPQLDDLVINSENKKLVRKLQAIDYPSQLFTCSETETKKKVMKTAENFTKQEYMDVAESVNQFYEAAEDKSAFAGCLVRLAGHDLMDFRYHFDSKGKKVVGQKGGVDGCINFNDKDNMGLAQCVQKSGILKAYDEHCGFVSLADFIVIAAESTIARASNSYKEQQKNAPLDRYAEGTLAKDFRDQFQFGRATAETCDWNTGLMPDPEKGWDDLNEIFGKHIFRYTKGKDKKKQITAIMGAHTLGSAKVENSGYKGAWSKTEGTFDNDYYRQMLLRGWGPDLAVGGNEGRNQWKTVDSGPEGGLMLNSDLCLAYDNNAEHQKCMAENNFNNKICKKFQKKGKPIIATETQCCAWTHKNALFNNKVLIAQDGKGMMCGTEIPKKGKGARFTEVKEACCKNQSPDSTGDCDSAAWPKGKAFRQVLDFASDEKLWLKHFTDAWKIATENGHIDLKQLINEEDKEEEDECGKLKTKQICETEKEKCAWQPKKTADKRGRFRNHCYLASVEAERQKVIKEQKDKIMKERMEKKQREKEERQKKMDLKKQERIAKKQKEKEERMAKMEAKKQARQARMDIQKMNKEEKLKKRAARKAQMEARKAQKEARKALNEARKKKNNKNDDSEGKK